MVAQSIFEELTVLGFIALFIFLCTASGFTGRVSIVPALGATPYNMQRHRAASDVPCALRLAPALPRPAFRRLMLEYQGVHAGVHPPM